MPAARAEGLDSSFEVKPIHSSALRAEYLRRLSLSQSERSSASESTTNPDRWRQLDQEEQARGLKGRMTAASGGLEAIPQAKRRVWLTESKESVQKRLGKPTSVDENDVAHYPGLTIQFEQGKVASYRCDTAFFQGSAGLRVGMDLREVLKRLPDSDGIFHQRLSAATESLHVLGMADGAVVVLQRNGKTWEAVSVSGMKGTAVMEYYADLKRKGGVRRLAPDYLFSLESRRRPLP